MSDKVLSRNARLVETFLFLENESLEMQKLCSLSGLAEEQVSEALRELSDHYFDSCHGLELVNDEGAYSFRPSADLFEDLKAAYGKKVDKRLSKAAMETLSIVAYSQPITRKEIDKIRGVVSDTIVRILRERDYIKVVGRKDIPGHPCLYGTTRKFLVEFGLKSISDLPKMGEVDRQRFEDET